MVQPVLFPPSTEALAVKEAPPVAIIPLIVAYSVVIAPDALLIVAVPPLD